MCAEISQTPKPPYKRKLRNFLINPSYQLKYIFWLGLSGILLVSLNSAIFYYYINENYTILVELSPMADDTKALLYSELNWIIIKLIVFSLGFLALVSLLGIVLSHRTAGALFHFKKIFNEIRNGNKNARLNLRPKDDFQDVAKIFNEMMDKLAGH